MTDKQVYDFQLQSIDGKPMTLGDFKGKVLLLVNVASECGFTPQYEGLEALHQKYKDRGLVVVGLPANEFGAQEPGSNEEIKEFCRSRFGVTFPMTGKIIVKGEGQHPLYAHIIDRTGEVTWNFNKVLIDRDGRVVQRFESKVEPESAELTQAIEKQLG